MTVQLDHTIVWARDKRRSADFLAGILGLAVGTPQEPFLPVRLGNGVTLDFADSADPRPQHYAFLVDDQVFDAALSKIEELGVTYYADPLHHRPHEINHWRGGRGLYFADPDGHNLELLTRS